MASTEKDTQRAVLDYLAWKKIFHYRQNSGGLSDRNGRFVRFGAVGAPDIIAVVDGIYYGLEIKDVKGKLSEGQKDFKERLENAGGIYIVVRSVDDVMSVI